MNQGRIWCVVNPTVGLPLFLGAVAVTSLIVHTAVLTHSSWYGPYVGLVPRAPRTAMNDTDKAAKADAGYTVTVAPSTEPGQPANAVVITVTPSQPAAPVLAAAPQADGAPAVMASTALK